MEAVRTDPAKYATIHGKQTSTERLFHDSLTETLKFSKRIFEKNEKRDEKQVG